jgi:hypothetical protein
MMLSAAAEALTSENPWAGRDPFLDRLDSSLSREDPIETAHRTIDLIHLSWLQSGSAEDAEGVTVNDRNRMIAELHRIVDTPYGSDPGVFEEDPVDGAFNTKVGQLRRVIPRYQATAAQRQLVKAGIELRRAALSDAVYPEDPSSIPELVDPEPFTGLPLVYAVSDDGSAVVELDGADSLLTQVVLKRAARIPPIHLPAL